MSEIGLPVHRRLLLIGPPMFSSTALATTSLDPKRILSVPTDPLHTFLAWRCVLVVVVCWL
jgi:hypothetical protein